MLEVVTGRFHPYLEDSFIDHLHRAKAPDPFAPVAVLVPSAQLADGIRRLVALERGLSLLNLHVLTFHQLALRLAEEAQTWSAAAPLRVVDHLFFEQLVRHLVRNRLPGLAPLRRIGHSSGTWAALWSTLRDLKDGGVDPAEALRGVDEGCFDEEEAEWLRALFSLYAAVREAGAALAVGTADDLAEFVASLAPASRFLASLRRIIYYGFYDLTQVQLSLLESVSAVAPTTLFFPLEEGSAYKFARRFFERHVQSKATSITVLPAPVGSSRTHPALSLCSVIGVEEELASTCRTILDLCETNGYRFHEIGVVARTLDPYRASLQEIFDRHCIPFVTTAGRPLIAEPLCKVLLRLASLPAHDFYRAPVLDVVSSPLYLSSLLDQADAEHRRPEQWKLLVSALRITHGRKEWERLQHASRARLALDGDADLAATDDGLEIAPEVIACCWKTVAELLDDCEALPERGTVGRLLSAFKNLAARRLRRPDGKLLEQGDPQAARLQATWSAVEQAWAALEELDAIDEELSWAEFVELLTHALERGSVPMQAEATQGVMVLDAMAARGFSFKALFILGLNEKTFPRYICEDPFLRDRHRLVLETTLGFKTDEKLAGYDEEVLLFTLLCRAATGRLYLSFQRADEQGRQLAVSPYVAEAAPRLGLPDPAVEALPRRITDRVARRPAMRWFLPPADLAQWMAIQGHDPARLLRAVGRNADLFRHATEALERIEDDSPSLTAFDGRTGSVPSHWSRILRRGIAPTPLERYARCPFQYFAADVLRLEPVRVSNPQEPDALELGTLCHATLRRTYESLLRDGWPAATLSADRMKRCVADAVTQAAAECEREGVGRHYLLWEMAKEQIASLVVDAVAADEETLKQEGYQPVAFELEAGGTLALTMGDQALPLKIHGRVDRVDRHRESGSLRIIDYKYKAGSAMKPEDNHLRQAAARGYRLQPPFYASLDLPGYGSARDVQFFYLAPHWPARIARRTFEAANRSPESGTLILRTITTLMEGIRDGRFFILPDTYCKTCDYRVACRREHQQTWWRAHRAPEAKSLRSIRSIKINDE